MAKRRCPLCKHPDIAAIESALRDGTAATIVAERFQTNDDAIGRHRPHMTAEPIGTELVVESGDNPVQTLRPNDPLVQWEKHEQAIYEAQLLISFSKGPVYKENFRFGMPEDWKKVDIKGWAAGIREWARLLDQENKMSGLYDHVDPRFLQSHMQRVIDAVKQNLEDDPDTRKKVLEAIEKAEKETVA